MSVVPKSTKEEDAGEVRRGPWTVEEDTILIQYISCHGEGRWNLLAKSAGLRRTGKSCRLRWLNYLKPDIKRGNLTLQEQLLILELHSRWGNRWSKIAQHLPGRTDNEIKNYWRTRVQKQAKQLNMETDSQGFIDTIRCFYIPRLVEKIEQNSAPSPAATALDSSSGSPSSPLHNDSIAFPYEMSIAGTDGNVDGGFKGGSSSSNQSPSSILSSYESSSKMSTLSQFSGGHPSMNNCSHEFGEISHGWESSALLSDDKSFCFMGSSGYEIEEMGSTSALTDDHVADHGWLCNEMTNDVWNLEGLW